MFATEISDRFLKARLSGDAVLMSIVTGVYDSLAPKGAAYPFVIFEAIPEGTGDALGTGAIRIKTSITYSVRVVVKNKDFSDCSPAAVRIDQVLHKKSGSVTGGGLVLSCIRTSPVKELEVDGQTGDIYRHLGGVYEVQVQGE